MADETTQPWLQQAFQAWAQGLGFSVNDDGSLIGTNGETLSAQDAQDIYNQTLANTNAGLGSDAGGTTKTTTAATGGSTSSKAATGTDLLNFKAGVSKSTKAAAIMTKHGIDAPSFIKGAPSPADAAAYARWLANKTITGKESASDRKAIRQAREWWTGQTGGGSKAIKAKTGQSAYYGADSRKAKVLGKSNPKGAKVTPAAAAAAAKKGGNKKGGPKSGVKNVGQLAPGQGNGASVSPGASTGSMVGPKQTMPKASPSLQKSMDKRVAAIKAKPRNKKPPTGKRSTLLTNEKSNNGLTGPLPGAAKLLPTPGNLGWALQDVVDSLSGGKSKGGKGGGQQGKSKVAPAAKKGEKTVNWLVDEKNPRGGITGPLPSAAKLIPTPGNLGWALNDVVKALSGGGGTPKPRRGKGGNQQRGKIGGGR